MATGLVTHADYHKHVTGPSHPESAERLRAIEAHLDRTGLVKHLTAIAPRPVEEEWLLTVHAPAYLTALRDNVPAQGLRFLDPDTALSPASHRAALLAAGGVLSAVDAVMAGTVRNAFCAVRPPGHHALADRAMGFCLLNNIAIAARYIQRRHGLARVLIVDWDVHHGNGTQAIFYDDPAVLYFSTHQYPYYPGTGAAEERGHGPGEGTTVNCPMPGGGGDAEYREAFEEVLVPAATAFRPDFILVSAGFDAHRDDPLAGMRLTEAGYAHLTEIVTQLAAELCRGRVVSALEGGYHLAALSRSVETHIRGLLTA